MPTFAAPDGTALAYRTLGAGSPLAGGPMSDSACLGDLGGPAKHRRLVVPDLRGTGSSAIPADPSSYRCDHQVEDVEAVGTHLRLDRFDPLGHFAGTNLAVSYAARHPERVRRLVLVTPSPRAVGIEVDGATRLEVAPRRESEPWFGPACTAFAAIQAGTAGAAEWTAMALLFYGRWDAAAQAHHAAQEEAGRNEEAAGRYGEDGAFDPATPNPALDGLNFPVLPVAGEWDLSTPQVTAAEFAGRSHTADSSSRPVPVTIRGSTTHGPSCGQPTRSSPGQSGPIFRVRVGRRPFC